MENHGFLNWRTWSTIRKGQAIGGAAGVLLTMVIPMLHALIPPRGAYDAVAVLGTVVFWPAWQLAAQFDWRPFLFTEQGLSIAALAFAIAVNSFLLLLVGSSVGWVVTKCKRSEKEIKP
jgi:hypothetical protein